MQAYERIFVIEFHLANNQQELAFRRLWFAHWKEGWIWIVLLPSQGQDINQQNFCDFKLNIAFDIVKIAL